MPNILGPIEGPLTEVLKFLTTELHSYGVAIILFTILVRLVLSPLNIKQLRSAKKMALLAPRIKEIQQRHKGDRERITKETMALYKEEGANPAAGCLPLLIQMPVLYGLFFSLESLAKTAHVGATAIYHQKFLLFVLDKPDHLFGQFLFWPHSAWGPLPILAALAQWVQTRMMAQPTSDPQQRTTQQIMQFMPLMILLFATNYPAGLALYWVTSTIFSVVMQYFITGWGQLFKSPFKPPALPAAPPKGLNPPSTPPSSGTSAPARSNGKAPAARANGKAPAARANGRARPPGGEDGQDATEEHEEVRLGKMQRAAMRPPTKVAPRQRSSKGAKR